MGIEDKEIKEFEAEKIALDVKTRVYQNSIAEELMNGGLGNDIIYRLKNPIRISRYQSFKLKLKYYLKTLFEVL